VCMYSYGSGSMASLYRCTHTHIHTHTLLRKHMHTHSCMRIVCIPIYICIQTLTQRCMHIFASYTLRYTFVHISTKTHIKPTNVRTPTPYLNHCDTPFSLLTAQNTKQSILYHYFSLPSFQIFIPFSALD
jgi:hypothetical protein